MKSDGVHALMLRIRTEMERLIGVCENEGTSRSDMVRALQSTERSLLRDAGEIIASVKLTDFLEEMEE